jgi:hypothetical protein
VQAVELGRALDLESQARDAGQQRLLVDRIDLGCAEHLLEQGLAIGFDAVCGLPRPHLIDERKAGSVPDVEIHYSYRLQAHVLTRQNV